MRKLPKIKLITSFGLLLAVASCEKHSTIPIEQNFTCVTTSDYIFSVNNRDVIMTLSNGTDWIMVPDTNDILYGKEPFPRLLKPCGKIPTEILKSGLKITVTGKSTYRNQITNSIYEYFILEKFNIKVK
jgi:hypothetical protein